jgi:hypothetical protein
MAVPFWGLFNTFNTSDVPQAYSVHRIPDSLLVDVEPTGGDPTMASVKVPDEPGYDVILAPLDVCCGVFDQLTRFDGPVPPMVQLDDVMLFMVRAGSVAAATASVLADCVTLGIELCDGATAPAAPDPRSGLWVVPPPAHEVTLPPASTVVAVIGAAQVAIGSTVGAP